MNKQVAHRAREIARQAGYDPDQLIVDIDKVRDFDFLEIGAAPVDIKKIHPVFMKFYDRAQEELWESQSRSIVMT